MLGSHKYRRYHKEFSLKNKCELGNSQLLESYEQELISYFCKKEPMTFVICWKLVKELLYYCDIVRLLIGNKCTAAPLRQITADAY